MPNTSVILRDPETDLNPRQMDFTRRLVKTNNARRAYAEAYGRTYGRGKRGYQAMNGATRLLRNPKVIRAIRLKFAPAGLTPDYVRASTLEYIEKGKVNHRWATAGAGLVRFAGQILGMVRDSDLGADGLSITFNVLQLAPSSIEERARALAERVAPTALAAVPAGPYIEEETSPAPLGARKTAPSLPQVARSRLGPASDTSSSATPCADRTDRAAVAEGERTSHPSPATPAPADPRGGAHPGPGRRKGPPGRPHADAVPPSL